MFRTKGSQVVATDRFVDLGFRHAKSWPRLGGDDMTMSVVELGHEERGPLLGLTATVPGLCMPTGPAHGHASDTFRISLLGQFTMGREAYGPGRFRLQEGWKAYPNDNNSCGPEGGWELVMMADRRGMRARLAQPDLSGVIEAITQAFCATYEITSGDIFSDDPSDTAGPSALASTLGRAEASGKLNGSFDDCASWLPVNGTTRAAVSLIGDAESGPVVILSVIDALGVVSPRARFGTELFRLVVAGSCEIEGRVYERGDMRVQHAGTWCGPIVAGAEGLQEVLVIGDRRMADPAVENGSWAFGDVVHGLLDELADPSTTRQGTESPDRRQDGR